MAEATFKLRVSIEPDSPATEEWTGKGIAGQVIKSDDERKYTLTVAYPVNKPDIGVAKDGKRDFAGPAAVEDAAWGFLTKSPKVGLWHQNGTEGAGSVVESYIYRGPDWSVAAADGSEQVIKSGDWLTGIVWDDKSWDDIKAGKIGGTSMQGSAMRRTATPADLIGLRS